MSLVNPNQLQHYGVTVSDDPTDSTRAFGITAEDGGVHVPFKMHSAAVYFLKPMCRHSMSRKIVRKLNKSIRQCGNHPVLTLRA
jgi:hypothetical protein